MAGFLLAGYLACIERDDSKASFAFCADSGKRFRMAPKIYGNYSFGHGITLNRYSADKAVDGSMETRVPLPPKR